VHEAAIALAIVGEVCERAALERIERVHTVFVRIGVMTAVVPEALQFAWDLATDGTPAAGARLQIEHVPLAIACASCNAERTIPSSTIPVCPVCGESSNDIVRGRELFVTAMEVEDAAAIAGRSAKHSAQEQHAGP
jgi:hydrogenase nickel incorporation protein HypA/HybF